MVSVDVRIKREARLFNKELDGVYSRRLDRLRSLLNEEVYNMLKRCTDAGTAREDAYMWLHGKSFDDTYRDYALKEKRARTKKRIEAILMLCGDDERLFLSEYTRSLDKWLPIPSAAFVWAPRLVKTASGSITVLHKWARTKKEPSTEEKE